MTHLDPAGHNPSFFWHDSYQYLNPAHSLLHLGTFTVDKGGKQMPYFVRPPAYPLFIAVCHKLFGESTSAILLPQLLLSAIGCSLGYWLGAMLVNRQGGLLVGLLLTLDQSLMAYSNKIMSEVFSLTFCLASTVFLVLFLAHRRWLHLVLSGALLGICTLAHPTSLYYWVIPVVVIAGLKGWSRKEKVRYAVVFAATYLFLVGIWQMRNYREFGMYELASKGHVFSFNGALVLWHQQPHRDYDEVATEFHHHIDELFIEKYGAAAMDWTDPEMRRKYFRRHEQLQIQETVRVFRAHFPTYAKLAFTSFLRYTVLPLPYAEICRFVSPQPRGQESESFRGKMAAAFRDLLRGHLREFWASFREVPFCKIVGFGWNVLYWWVTIPAALFGSYVMIRRWPWPYALLLLGTIGYFSLTTSLTKAGDGMQRYRLRIVPYVYCIAAVGWIEILDRRKRAALAVAASGQAPDAPSEQP